MHVQILHHFLCFNCCITTLTWTVHGESWLLMVRWLRPTFHVSPCLPFKKKTAYMYQGRTAFLMVEQQLQNESTISTGWWFQPLLEILYSPLGLSLRIYGTIKFMFQSPPSSETCSASKPQYQSRWIQTLSEKVQITLQTIVNDTPVPLPFRSYDWIPRDS